MECISRLNSREWIETAANAPWLAVLCSISRLNSREWIETIDRLCTKNQTRSISRLNSREWIETGKCGCYCVG